MNTALAVAVFAGGTTPLLNDVLSGTGGAIFHETIAAAQGPPDPALQLSNTAGNTELSPGATYVVAAVPTDSTDNRPTAVTTFEVTMADSGPPVVSGFAVSGTPTETSFAVTWAVADTGDENKGVDTPLTIAVFAKGEAPESFEHVIDGTAADDILLTATVADGRGDSEYTFDGDDAAAALEPGKHNDVVGVAQDSSTNIAGPLSP